MVVAFPPAVAVEAVRGRVGITPPYCLGGYAIFQETQMEPSSLRVVHIDKQRWVVRAVRRLPAPSVTQPVRLRFFNGAESRYVSDFPSEWPQLPDSDLTSLFERAAPNA